MKLGRIFSDFNINNLRRYSQASNLEFMIRYGFKVEKNPYGGRHFELQGENLQQYCPAMMLRTDLPEVLDNSTIDCHRQARYISFQKVYGNETKITSDFEMTREEQVQEDVHIYNAVQQACVDLLR